MRLELAAMELYEQRPVHSPGHLFLPSTDWSVALLTLEPSRLCRQIAPTGC